MKANYGYKDGSGEFFITIDTDKCNSCGECVEVCPASVLIMVPNDFDIEADDMPAVSEEQRWKIKYACAPCKPVDRDELPPCIKECKEDAIEHSW
jgi:ferredoxin